MPRLTTRITPLALLALAGVVEAACAAPEARHGSVATTSVGTSAAVSPRASGVGAAPCLIDSGAVSPTALMIDVREPAARSRVPINNATVIPLADLPGWSAPGTAIALVGSGLNQSELLTHCKQLRRRGIDVSVVDGGAQTLTASAVAPASVMQAAVVDADAVVGALRSESGTALITWSASASIAGATRMESQPTPAALRELARMSGPRILVGDRPTAERWWSALRGAGAGRVFIYDGSVDALKAASAQLDSVHQGRHWVAPTPCERQG